MNRFCLLVGVAAMLASTLASAEIRVTYKSAKSTSSYYQMAVQIAEAIKSGTGGGIIVTVEESQGSAPNVVEAAAGVPIRVLSLSEEQVTATRRTRLVIPAGTYSGVDHEVVTTSLPVGAYATAAMDEETAYTLVKTFWEKKEKMAASNPWWGGVSRSMLGSLGARLHPGALRYYHEAGFSVPAELE